MMSAFVDCHHHNLYGACKPIPTLSTCLVGIIKYVSDTIHFGRPAGKILGGALAENVELQNYAKDGSEYSIDLEIQHMHATRLMENWRALWLFSQIPQLKKWQSIS